MPIEAFNIGARALRQVRGALRDFKVTVKQNGQTDLENVQCTRLKMDDELDLEVAILNTRRLDLVFTVSDLWATLDERSLSVTFPDGTVWRPFAESGIPAFTYQGVTQESVVMHCKRVSE